MPSTEMKIFVAHSGELNFQDELYTPIRNSELNSRYDFFLPHENGREVNTKEEIRSSDLVVAEASYSSMGEGIELGWADMLGKKIICFHKESEQPSKWLKMISDTFIPYKNTEDLINLLGKELEKQNKW